MHCSVRELVVLGSFVGCLCRLPQQTQSWCRGSCRPCSALAASCGCAAQGVRSVCLSLHCFPPQAALSEDANESPYRVRSVLRVQVSVAAVELQSAGGTLLMQASMGGVDTRTVLYSQTQDIALSVSTVSAGRAGRHRVAAQHSQALCNQ